MMNANRLRSLKINGADCSLRRTQTVSECCRVNSDGDVLACNPGQAADMNELADRIEAAVAKALADLKSVNKPGRLEVTYDAAARKVLRIEKAAAVGDGGVMMVELNPITAAAIRTAVEAL